MDLFTSIAVLSDPHAAGKDDGEAALRGFTSLFHHHRTTSGATSRSISGHDLTAKGDPALNTFKLDKKSAVSQQMKEMEKLLASSRIAGLTWSSDTIFRIALQNGQLIHIAFVEGTSEVRQIIVDKSLLGYGTDPVFECVMEERLAVLSYRDATRVNIAEHAPLSGVALRNALYYRNVLACLNRK